MTEDEFVDADVNHEIGHLSQEYRQWRRRRQTDGAAKFKTEFETEVNLNINLNRILASILSTGLKLKFKT